MLKLATFNLYQFAKPGTYWYEEKPRNTYAFDHWNAKKGWISNQLAEMGADIVGFQEIFDVEEFTALCHAAGYPHVATVDTPKADETQPHIMVGPIVALASKHPILAAAAVPIPDVIRNQLPVEEDYRFSRTPIRAVIDIPHEGHLVVYVAHLKSKRPSATPPDFTGVEDWTFMARETMRATSRGHAASLLQRGAEAATLYHALTEEIIRDENTPIVVLGDLNDDPDSIPIEAVTMRGRMYEINEVASADWPSHVFADLHAHRFRDAWTLAPQEEDTRAPTHFYRGEGGVLDYILVSNALNNRNRRGRGRVAECVVLNEHLKSDGVGDRVQSDHGQVLLTLEFASGNDPFIVEGLPVIQTTDATGLPTPPVVTEPAGGLPGFMERAGGTFTNFEGYRSWSGSQKYENFWAFFFDNDYGWVKSAYGRIPISTLHQKQRYSIEHIIPQSFLRRYLGDGPSEMRRGATTNPLNFVAAERDTNSNRSSFPFDWEGDEIVRPYRIPLNPDAYGSFGLDAEHEWVIPPATRGELARAILYMVITYEIRELYNAHVDQLRHWARVDPANPWELDFNRWVESKHGIRNPFIDAPEAAQRWLDDEELMAAPLLNT